ncbi:MAG: alpha/beta hydrolase [Phyllobacteriaceae bacterium]|nr:alpha/beta hydrolase [Phyllobacteriaceae bacterium]
MRRLGKAILLLLIVLAAAFVLGPRPDTAETMTFDAATLDPDLDAHLARSEAAYSDIRAGLHKGIIWADPAAKTKTPVSIVYLHGYSASRVEIDPVPQNVARALGANLYYTRLSGHGRSNDAMAEAKLTDWFDDTAEALEIGRRLGDKVLVLSVSTGGTLATWAASQPELAAKMDGLVMISPNYAVHGAPIWLLNMPWAETLLPLILGAERSWEPRNEGQAHGWTTRYPSKAVFPMGALLKVVSGIDPASLKVPALFIYSMQDKVVVPERAADVAKAWGGPAQVVNIETADDENHHVIAGDILSPGTTDAVSGIIIDWARGLFNQPA